MRATIRAAIRDGCWPHCNLRKFVPTGRCIWIPFRVGMIVAAYLSSPFCLSFVLFADLHKFYNDNIRYYLPYIFE